MTVQIGRLVKVGLARETDRGVGVTPAIWIPQTSASLAARIEDARVEGAIGSIADSEGRLVVEKFAEGDIGGELRSQSIGYLLYALLGVSVPTGPTDESYSHAFSLSESNQHTSLSIVVKDENLDEMYKLSMLNSLEISVELGGLVQFVANFLTKKPVASSNTYTRPTDFKFSKKHVKLYIATNLAGLDAAAALDLKHLTLSINKNAERDNALGTIQPVDILNKQISIEGSFSLNFEDNTYRDYMLEGDEKAVRIDIENTDQVIGGGTTNPRLRIELPKVDFSGFEPDRSLNEIVKQTLDFKANYHATNGLISTCELINAKEDY